jgi:hypothetical protein
MFVSCWKSKHKKRVRCEKVQQRCWLILLTSSNFDKFSLLTMWPAGFPSYFWSKSTITHDQVANSSNVLQLSHQLPSRSSSQVSSTSSPTASTASWWVKEGWRSQLGRLIDFHRVRSFKNLSQISVAKKQNVGRKHLGGGETEPHLSPLPHLHTSPREGPLSCGPTSNIISKRALDLGSHSTTLSDHKSHGLVSSEVGA